MAVFHGDKNLTLGHPAEVISEYDHDLHKWVITVDSKVAAGFRKVAAEYGFVEQGKADKAEKPADES